MKITLIIPAYNESKIIAKTVTAAETYMSRHFGSYEIIVVNDGSGDNTANIVSNMQSSCVRLINYAANSGKGYAVSRGVAEATGDIVFFTDADLAYGLEPLEGAAEKLLRADADIVAGSRRINRGAYAGYPLIRGLAARLFNFTASAITGMKYDTLCGFRGYKREAAAELFSNCREKGMAFDFEILTLAGRADMKIVQVPVRVVNCKKFKGERIKRRFKLLFDLFVVKRRLLPKEKREKAKKKR